MSAQRRSSAANRRARGAAGRKPGATTTVDAPVESGPSSSVAVAEAVVKPSSKPAVAGGPKPRMAAGGQVAARTERLAGVKRYIADTRAELRRVTWPDQITVRNLTGVVIAVSAVMGLLLGGIDFVLLKIFEAL